MKRALALALLSCACIPGKIEFPDDSAEPDDSAGGGEDSDGGSGGGGAVTGPLERMSGESPLTDQVDATLVGEMTVNLAGRFVQHAGDMDGDGHGDVLTVTNMTYNAEGYGDIGGVYLARGPIEGERSLGEADAIVRAGDDAGVLGYTLHTLAGGEDLDGDGYTDVTVSGGAYNEAGVYEEHLWMMAGPLDGLSALSDASATLRTDTSTDLLAGEVLHLDLDGDGQDDLLGALTGGASSPSSAGSVVTFLGPISGGLSRGAADTELVGVSGDGAGAALAGGDFNGDGTEDVAIGARTVDSSSGTDVGAVYVLYGPVTDSVLSLASADAVVYGTAASGRLGEEVWAGGDSDADGYAELVTAAPYAMTAAGTQGAVYLLAGPIEGDADVSAARATLTSASIPYTNLYSQWTSADLDLDGHDDGVLSSGFADGYNGKVFLHYGPISGARVIDDGGSDAVWTGNDSTASYLVGLDARGDIDADGAPDLLVGAPNSVGDAAASQAGRVHILLGGVL